MPVSREYLDYLIDQLRSFGQVAPKRMFGGAGLYHDGLFFGLVADDVLYLKVDDGNRKDFSDAGMKPFRPFGSHAMGYFEVPADVLEDPDELAAWAWKAFEAAGRPRKSNVRIKAGRKTRRKEKQ